MKTTSPTYLNQWFIIFAIIYAIANLIAAIKIDFESSIFLPFRYEGLLFFQNAISSDTNAFFFIRDWSTSFLPEEHPLLYFHNLDLIHFFAGFVQYFSSHGKIILFTLSLLISLLGLWMIARDFNKHLGTLFTVLFMALLVFSVGAFRLSPQNLFITLGIFSVIWNLILLRKIWYQEALDFKFFLELFGMFLLVAAVETNLAVMLVIITGFFALFSTKTLFKFDAIKRIFLIGAISALPIVLFRLIQLASIYYYGYLNEYMADISYTSQLKVHSNINTLDAIAFYAQHGLTFFGQPQKMTTHVQDLTLYYRGYYGNWIWFFILFVSLLTLLGKQPIKKLTGPKKYAQFQNVTFLSSYLLSFTIASYLLLFLSGDAIIKVFLSKFGIMDIAVVYRAFFILLIPLILYIFIDHKNKVFIYLFLVMILLLLTYICKNLILETRQEYFGYKKVLSLIPKNSNIISNFEPSVLAVETQSRINMSWFDKHPDSCSLLNSKGLLKMYKVNKKKYKNRDLYVFLVYYLPYARNTKEFLLNRHCVKRSTHKLLYEDKLYLLYKINEK